MGTCVKNLHMTGLHCIQVVDHFKRWTILVLNRNVLGMWTIGTALLCIKYTENPKSLTEMLCRPLWR